MIQIVEENIKTTVKSRKWSIKSCAVKNGFLAWDFSPSIFFFEEAVWSAVGSEYALFFVTDAFS